MFPKPHISPDSFFHETLSTASTSTSSPPITIYFISGNPGLISYYHAFLSSLANRLSLGPSSSSDEEAHQVFHLLGYSLAGFELENDKTNVNASNSEKKQGGKEQDPEQEHYHDLEEQICFVRTRLEGHMRAFRREYTDSRPFGNELSKPKPKVILIGHSVGSYIAMEILRRHREKQQQQQQQQSRHQMPEANGHRDDREEDFDIIGGIMLFPTVVDIAKSPSGRKLTFLLSIIPQLALVISLFARFLTALLPESMLRSLVRFAMRSPPDPAVEATASFLKSRKGVRQALHMAADEMRTITADKWSDDVWGVSSSGSNGDADLLTRLFFYFGRNDHWVAEETRDEIIALRGSAKEGPRMVVCEEALPHAFCLRHNEIMATKVAGMIHEITGLDCVLK
ncbi:hypothetical protein BJX61DRAFT_439268 [Aspergillus egyptiacus]|nr:hypothetical protein BJX61DRAFT_439268 [Aspergillus egyptiacus]